MALQIFNKSYSKWKFYSNRDLLLKLNLNNVNKIPEIRRVVVKHNILKPSDIFSSMSLNILLFDEYPMVSKIKNTIDNKKKNIILGTKITLSHLKFFFFFLRLKYEEGITSLVNKLKLSNKNSEAVTFCFNLNLFDEFLNLYDKYPNLSEISVTLTFVNCKKMEEKQLLLNNLLII